MAVSARVAAERQARYGRRMAAAEAVVPEGPYCYERLGDMVDGRLPIKLCPYWKARRDWPEQGWGFCRLLKAGNNTQGRDAAGRPRATFLLWDQVKECGLNPGDDGFED